MPEPISATVAFVTAAYSSAVAATATVLGAMGTVGALGMGGTYALAGAIVKGGIMMGLSAASAALLRPDVPSSGTTLDFKPDPKAPIRGAMGYTALGGNKVFQATWGYKRVAMSLGVALSLGPIDQVPRFEADGATVTFSGPQNEATGFYAADMWQRTTLGLPGDAALLPPTGLKYGNPGLTGWGTLHAAPQVSFSFWTMVLAKNPEDRDVFTNGVPDPRWIGRWMKLWDPRKDSTYPGGSGPQRRDDWRTWEWSESPYVHALAWVRGHYKLNLDGTIDRSKRIAGIGAPDAAIDIPAFVEGMNVAQANNWTISGEWSTSDGKFQTLLAMLQAGGGEPISRGAQISVMVNAPRVATYTYTRDDLIGQAEIRPLTPRRERKNTIVPRYKSEANGWQYVPAGEVTSSVYREEDRGEPRSLEIEYTHVRNAKQAGQLAAYDLANLREGLTATLPSKVHLMHVHPGDCITVDVPELALAGQKFVVRRATGNHQAASVTLELRSESDGKHAWALGQAAQPAPSPSLSAVDPKYVPPPAPEDWTVVPKPPGEGGVSQPIVIIELPIETTDIVAVIIKHGPSAAGPWTDGYEGSPRPDGRYEVAGLTPGQTYCFSLQYVAKNGAKSEPDIKCEIVAGDLTAGNVVPTAPTIVAMQDAIDLASDGIEALDNAVGSLNATVYTAGTGLLARTDAMFDTLNTPTTGVLARLTTVENKQTSDNGAAVDRLNALEATVNTPTTGLVARMATQESATVSLQTGKADVSRVAALEATVNTPGTGLSARMGAAETAVTSLQTQKASVERVATLEAFATSAVSPVPFDAPGAENFYTESISGGAAAPSSRIVAVTGEGKVFELQSIYLSPLAGAVLSDSGAYRVRARVRRTEDPTTGDRRITVYLAAFDKAEQYLGALSAVVESDLTIGMGWRDVASPLWTTADVRTAYPTTHTIRPVVRGGSAGSSADNGTIQAKYLNLDVQADTAALSGRVTTLETATTDLQAGKADATRVAALEATVNTAGTGLVARTGALETATVNLQTTKADATRVLSLEAQADGGSSNRNPRFLAWSDSEAVGPDSWTRYNSGNVTVSKGPGRNGAPWSFRQASTGTSNTGAYQDTTGAAPGGEQLMLEADFTLVSGSLQGSGLSLDTMNAGGSQVRRSNVNFATEIGGNGVAGKTYRIRKLVDARHADAASYRLYTMTRLSTFSPVGSATIDWERAAWRPATAEEAILPDVASRVGTLETATANLQAGKADASRVTSLEATVNTPGTGLTARLTTVENVAASADGTAKAIKGVVLDVNGYVSGYSSVNDGTTSAFEILTDVFALRAPGSGERMEMRSGNTFIYSPSENTRTRYGKAFGGAQKLVWWTGPTSVAEGSETKANAYVYMSQNTVSGPRFGGSDVAGGGKASGVRSFSSGPGGASVETTINGIQAGSQIGIYISLSGGSLSTNSNSNGTVRLYEVAGGNSRLLLSQGVVTVPNGIQNPNGSWGILEAPAATGSAIGQYSGDVTYRAEYSRSSGSSYVQGAVINATVTITPPI